MSICFAGGVKTKAKHKLGVSPGSMQVEKVGHRHVSFFDIQAEYFVSLTLVCVTAVLH